MRAILIDPYARECHEVEHDGTLDSIYRYIDADCFAIARFDMRTVHPHAPHGEAAEPEQHAQEVFVDDEGLLNITPETMFFEVEGYAQPLAGKGLVLASNADGETIATDLSLEDVQQRVKFMTLWDVRQRVREDEAERQWPGPEPLGDSFT